MDNAERELAAWLQASLRAHLSRSPHAADTLEGIATFWVPGGEDVPRELLARVLRQLVLEGALTARRLPDGTVLYGGTGADGEPGP